MEEQPAQHRHQTFVDRIVTDPNNPPDTLLLVGYLGASSEEGYRRLYFDPQLSDYVEIPNDAILHTQDVPTDESPLGGSYVWIKADAELIHGKVGANRPKAKFLEGRIAQQYMGGAQFGGAAAGAGGAAGAQNFPWSVVGPACQSLAIHLCHTIVIQRCWHTVLPAVCPTLPWAGCPQTVFPPCPPVTFPGGSAACPSLACGGFGGVGGGMGMQAFGMGGQQPVGGQQGWRISLPFCPSEACVPTRLYCPTHHIACPTRFCPSEAICPSLACPSLACPSLACPSLACPSLACGGFGGVGGEMGGQQFGAGMGGMGGMGGGMMGAQQFGAMGGMGGGMMGEQQLGQAAQLPISRFCTQAIACWQTRPIVCYPSEGPWCWQTRYGWECGPTHASPWCQYGGGGGGGVQSLACPSAACGGFGGFGGQM